jgi:hypothetical protein
MKTLKCRLCKKTVQVKDDYSYKTCEPCRIKEKKQRTEKKQQSEQQKILEKIEFSEVDFKSRKRFLESFLRFDLFEPSKEKQCILFRLQKLALWKTNPYRTQLYNHLELCPSCSDWLYNLENDLLTDKESRFLIAIAYAKDFKTSEEFEKMLKTGNCKIMGVNEAEKYVVVLINQEASENTQKSVKYQA